MMLFTQMSIKNKIVLIILSVSFIVITLSTGVISYLYLNDLKKDLTDQSIIKAKLVGDYSLTALSFNFPDHANEILQKIENDPSIVSAEIFREDLTIFASYPSFADSTITLANVITPSVSFAGDILDVYEPISYNNQVYGYIHIQSNTNFNQKIRKQFAMVILLFAGVMLIAMLVARRLQSIISNPIISLSNTARLISQNHNYSIRVNKVNSDEIGELYNNFNALLSETQQKEMQRDEAISLLREHKDNLEQKIKERTATLMSTQKELIDNAHKAGMADIASGALHNVGNILNSIKTSATLIKDFHQNSSFSRYKQANDLLRQNIDDLENFILHDPKGKKLLQYYLEIEHLHLPIEKQIASHIERLLDKVNSSAEVIHAQQSYASSASLTEKYDVRDIITDAISMESNELEKNSLTILQNFEPVAPILVQRTKLIHIIINLINNSIEAMHHLSPSERILAINVYEGDACVVVDVIDNGEGISPENLNNIFSHGFTTKKEGHGFGLHSCANYMTEMGGSMQVKSDGTKPGATFTLSFPIRVGLD